MSHDLYASLAASELAQHFQSHPADCFHTVPATGVSVFAAREGRTRWPFADGVIVIQAGTTTYRVALEFKRVNEGRHGLLTALGQSMGYVDKGYHGAVIVLPRQYRKHTTPGPYASTVLSRVLGKPNFGVVTYDDPNTSSPAPFAGKLYIDRVLEVDSVLLLPGGTFASNVETQWMHVREGSSTPSAFFRFLQVAKQLRPTRTPEPGVRIPFGLVNAIRRINPAADPRKYLSNSSNDSFRDKAWRHFWFKWVVTSDVMEIWKAGTTPYTLNDVPTRLHQWDGMTPMTWFSKRKDSIKKTLVAELNAGTITEDDAWRAFAIKIHDRAHSFREDVDSGLEHIGMLEADGLPADLGYRFLDVCERTNAPHEGTPKSMLSAAVLKNGDMILLLHYVHQLSEELFRGNPLQFSTGKKGDRLSVSAYRAWLAHELAHTKRVLTTGTKRGGHSRPPLQGEITMLRKLGFVSGYRIGLGLEINWPAVQASMDFAI